MPSFKVEGPVRVVGLVMTKNVVRMDGIVRLDSVQWTLDRGIRLVRVFNGGTDESSKRQ